MGKGEIKKKTRNKKNMGVGKTKENNEQLQKTKKIWEVRASS